MMTTLLGSALVSLGCLAMEPQTEAVRLWVEPAVDWQQDYRVSTRLSMSSEGQTNVLEQDVHVRLAIVSVDEQTARVRTTVQHADVRADVGGTERRYQSEPGAGDEQTDELVSIYEVLEEAVLEFRITEGGELELVSGLERVLEAADMVMFDGRQYLGIFVPGSVERAVSYMLTLEPDRTPRQVEEVWPDGYTMPVFGGRQASVDVEYRLEEVREDAAVVSGDVSFSLLPQEQPQVSIPQLRIVEQSGSVRGRWDTDAGRLVSRSASTRVVWGAKFGPEEVVETTATVTMNIDIALLADPEEIEEPELPEEGIDAVP